MKFEINEPVTTKHRRIHDGRVIGFTKSGLIKVKHNGLHPYGVGWVFGNYHPDVLISTRVKVTHE